MTGAGRRLGLLASLYVCQGLPFGFFTQALPVMLRRDGVSLEAIGLSSLLAMPWALKFLWAPLVDRWFWPAVGRRRSWILPMQALTVVALLAVAWVDPSRGLGPLLMGVVLVNLLSATQDIATDGLAVDLLPASERGLANGVQVAGYRAGMIVGGGALLVVFERIGWQRSFVGMAVLVALLSVPVLRMREPASATVETRGERPSGVTPLWRRPGAARMLALLAVYKLGDAFAVGMLRPWLADQGLGLAQVGWMVGTVGFVAGLVGAMMGGALVPRLGRRTALEVFAVLQALAVGGYALAAMSSVSLTSLAVLCACEHLAGGMATAALFTTMMDGSDPRTGATDYTLQASLVVVVTGAATALSGVSASHLGYAGHFTLAAALAALVPLAVRGLFREPAPVHGG